MVVQEFLCVCVCVFVCVCVCVCVCNVIVVECGQSSPAGVQTCLHSVPSAPPHMFCMEGD